MLTHEIYLNPYSIKKQQPPFGIVPTAAALLRHREVAYQAYYSTPCLQSNLGTEGKEMVTLPKQCQDLVLRLK